MAQKLDELPVYIAAKAFWVAVNAILETPRLRRDRRLYDQISRAADSITANMGEGFEQSTDRAFAGFLVHAKASLAEVLVRLDQARHKEYITEKELKRLNDAGTTLAGMIGGFIKYLRACDWKDRGSFKVRQSLHPRDPTEPS
jgi:four helix bundle protein